MVEAKSFTPVYAVQFSSRNFIFVAEINISVDREGYIDIVEEWTDFIGMIRRNAKRLLKHINLEEK